MIVLFVLLRWAVGGFDISYFIVAGSQSCDSTVTQIMVQPGYSYDGEYYYRYALAPLNAENPYQGIYVSTPAYRHQRILYPIITWFFSLGGKAFMIPFMLVFVNVCCFVLFIAGAKKLLERFGIQPHYLIITLLLPGVWMALARDLAEVVEICLFVYLVLAYCDKNKLLFLVLATAILFTRETSGIVLAAFALHNLYFFVKHNKREAIHWLACAVVPVMLFVLFKYWVMKQYQTTTDTGAFNFNILPFKGLLDGSIAQWNGVMQTGVRGVMILLFSLAHIALIGWAFVLGLSHKNKLSDTHKWMRSIIILWILVCLFLGVRMWETDWGFARALTIPLFCAMFLSASTNRLSKIYIIAAIGLQFLMLVRLIAKV
jgi:hypothetical protein